MMQPEGFVNPKGASHETGPLYAVVSAILTYRKALSPGEIHPFDDAAFLMP